LAGREAVQRDPSALERCGRDVAELDVKDLFRLDVLEAGAAHSTAMQMITVEHETAVVLFADLTSLRTMSGDESVRCPNLNSMDLVALIEAEGIATGIDLDEMMRISERCERILKRQLHSMVTRAGSSPQFRKKDGHV
jgi:hypothetical protein